MGVLFIKDNNQITKLGPIKEFELVNGKPPPYVQNMSFELSDKTELTCECDINLPLLHKMISADISRFGDATSFTATGQMPHKVQARHHKKKRINKKWLKRYGYKTVMKLVSLTDIRFTPGTNEFECNMEGLYGN